MTAALSHLAAPTTLAGLPLSSHFVMAPMTRKRSPGGVPTREVAEYYRRRAEGGIGLIISEGALVGHPSASHETDVPRLTPGPAREGWRLVTDGVHAAGGRIAAQIWHLGSERVGAPTWTPATMTGRDFEDLLQAYARSARVAVEAGFDAVEIHGAHGYLIDEFLWPVTNRRRDRYGRRRWLFPAEVIRAVRAEIPREMPLIVRFSQFKERDYAARIAESPAELEVILAAFAAAGADVLHASQRRFWEPAFEGYQENLAGWAKRLTGLPSITVGSVGLADGYEERLLKRYAGDEFDLVAAGRILLGNPDWARLVTTGRDAEVRDYTKADEDAFH